MAKNIQAHLNGHYRHASMEDARSAEINELMGKMPHWMVRGGITLTGILFLCILAIGWFVQYPDVINARIAITPCRGAWEAVGDVPEADTWRIKAGQKVLIRLTAYPYEEFGMLQGTVCKGGELREGHYKIRIQLDQQLRTHTGKLIPGQPQLEGRGEILMEERRVLQRVFGKLLPE